MIRVCLVYCICGRLVGCGCGWVGGGGAGCGVKLLGRDAGRRGWENLHESPYHIPVYVIHAAGGIDFRRASVCMVIAVVAERVRPCMHPFGRHAHGLDGQPISCVLA